MDILRPGTKQDIEKSREKVNFKPKPSFSKSTASTISWKTKEFSYYEKTKLWFAIGGGIFFILLGYSIVTKQLIASLLWLLIGITVYAFSLKKPRNIKCQIDRNGISVEKIRYSFRDLESFWIFYEPPELKIISIKHKKPYLPYVQVPLGEEDPQAIRQALLEHLSEEEQDESFSDKFARYLRF